MDMRLDDSAMKDIIAKSIIDSLTPEKREALIAEAVKGLLSETTGNTYNRRTKLQEAFDFAVQQVARDVAAKELANDPTIREKVRELFRAAWDKQTTGDNAEKLVDKIGSAIAGVLSGESRY